MAAHYHAIPGTVHVSTDKAERTHYSFPGAEIDLDPDATHPAAASATRATERYRLVTPSGGRSSIPGLLDVAALFAVGLVLYAVVS